MNPQAKTSFFHRLSQWSFRQKALFITLLWVFMAFMIHLLRTEKDKTTLAEVYFMHTQFEHNRPYAQVSDSMFLAFLQDIKPAFLFTDLNLPFVDAESDTTDASRFCRLAQQQGIPVYRIGMSSYKVDYGWKMFFPSVYSFLDYSYSSRYQFSAWVQPPFVFPNNQSKLYHFPEWNARLNAFADTLKQYDDKAYFNFAQGLTSEMIKSMNKIIYQHPGKRILFIGSHPYSSWISRRLRNTVRFKVID